jgi:citryl-CoA lyase
MEFETDISTNIEGEHYIYNQKVTDLMQKVTFTDSIFLLYAGVLPTASQRNLLDAMLIAAAEHGVEAPSLYVPRVSTSSGNPVHVAMAAGVLAIGDVHGGAGEAAVLMLMRKESAEKLVAEYLESGKRLPGFGHKIYSDEDPRARIIFDIAAKNNLPLVAFEKARSIETALATAKGKKFPLNVDGAFAAGVITLGLPPAAAKALFVLARAAGMGAHAIEESTKQHTYRRL